MPDVTISFTDAQWARIVAASASIRRTGGDVDASYLSTKLKELVSSWVQGHEKSVVDVATWE